MQTPTFEPTQSSAGGVPAPHGTAMRTPMEDSFVYVLVLNWNGWSDTIECLESVLRGAHWNQRIIVCDNDSRDGSLEHIKAWADGRLDVVVPREAPREDLSRPPVAKPIPYVEYDRAGAESGGGAGDADARLVLIQTGANLGWAGGCNVGLRYALARDDYDYVWLLNPDTVVRPDSLEKMLLEMGIRTDAGMCGSTLLDYERPQVVETLGGGMYFKWFGVGRPIGKHQSAATPVDAARVRARLAYVSGTSLLVSRACLGDTGLPSEVYFLYGEDIDWGVTARARYTLTFAPDSIVYHRKAASTGSGSGAAGRSALADYYYMRNRLVITRKFYPFALPTVYLGLILSALNRVRLGKWTAVKNIVMLVARRGRD